MEQSSPPPPYHLAGVRRQMTKSWMGRRRIGVSVCSVLISAAVAATTTAGLYSVANDFKPVIVAAAFSSTSRHRFQRHVVAGKTSNCLATSLAYSNAADPPLSDPTSYDTKPSFVERMRQSVLQQQASTTTSTPVRPQRTHHSPSPHVYDVINLADFNHVIQTGRSNGQVTAVQWYAPWCRACRRTLPAFAALRHKPKRPFDSVQYVSVSAQATATTTNTKDQGQSRRTTTSISATSLHAAFGIVTVPYSHIYHPTAGLVEELKISNATLWTAFEQILQSYVQGYCPLSSDVHAETGVYAAPYERVS